MGLSSQVLLRALRSDLDLAAPGSPRDLDLAAAEEPAFLDDDETFSRTVRPPVNCGYGLRCTRPQPACVGLQRHLGQRHPPLRLGGGGGATRHGVILLLASQVQRAVHLKRMILEDLQTSYAVRGRPATEALQTSYAGRQQRQLPEPEPRDGDGDGDGDGDESGAEPSTEDDYVPMAMAPPQLRGHAQEEEPGLHEAPKEELVVDDEAELL